MKKAGDPQPAALYRLPPGPPLANAACKGMDVRVFFPERGEPTGAAKAVCARCDELDACRAFALTQPETHLIGIWGGLTGKQRRQERRRRLERREDRQPMTSSHTLAELDEPTDEELLEMESEQNGPDPSAHMESRTCRGCGEPISGHASRQWCSNRCRKAHSAPAAPARAAAAGRNRNTVALRSTPGRNGADGHTASASGEQADATPGPPDRFGGLYRALMLAGATVVRVDVTFGCDTWRVERVANGKDQL
jgi:WhiB family transcriptional regulator, redox-sensing transcriptional regulator